MKAKEVLKRYAAGERNFQRVNLRGQSFKEQNLSGADFSEADIRSTDFTGANLQGAKFISAKCGLQRRWVAFQVGSFCLLIMIFGLYLIFGIDSILSILNFDNRVENHVSILLLILFFIVLQGIKSVSKALASGDFITGQILIFFIAAGVGTFAMIPVAKLSNLIAPQLPKLILAGTLIGVTLIGIVLVTSIAIMTGILGIIGMTIAILILILFTLQFGVPEFFLSNVIALEIIYISWNLVEENQEKSWIFSFAVVVSSVLGTSFNRANLTDANFTSTKLKSADFRNANLTRVRWYGSKMLDCVRSDDTYLKNSQLRQWLIGEGKEKNFDRQDLRGINLQGEKNLTDASFIGADLSGANLQDADLSRAKLVQTQLDNTDFTGATLTGAVIEDWGITSSTKLNGVECEYIFMRLPPEKRPNCLALPVEESLDPNPRRKPDNWNDNFAGDDFADFIKPIFDTLDLYHNQGVDPRAIAISWKKLAENNSDANLRFASMEVKGEDNLLLRLKTAPNIDKSRLNSEYFETYNQIKALTEAEAQKLLTEKDNRIQQLENMVNTALKRPSFYAENYQGDTVMTGEKRDIKIDRGNYNEKIEGNYYEQKGDNNTMSNITQTHSGSGDNVAGDKNTTNNYNSQDLPQAAAEIQQLLA